MTDITQMVEQHILAYESRQKHMDEALVRARAHVWDALAEQLETLVEKLTKH